MLDPQPSTSAHLLPKNEIKDEPELIILDSKGRLGTN